MARVMLHGGGQMILLLRRTRWFLLAAVSGWFASPAVAQTSPNLQTVTLEQALTYARAHQPQIRSALAEYEARRADARVPRGQWLPQVGATAQIYAATANNTTASYLGVPEVDIPRIGGSPSKTQATATWSPSASTITAIGVSQEVYDFGRISAQIAVADAYAAMSKATADAVELDVQLGVAEAYDAVLSAKGVLAATEDAHKRAVTHRDYAQAGTKSGLRPPIDLTRAQADVLQLEVRLIQARTGVVSARAALAAAMGADALEIDAAPVAVDTAPGPAFAQAVQVALKANPAIVAAVAKLEAQRSVKSAITRELLPNLSATAALSGRAGGAEASGNPPTPYGDGWLPDVANWHVGLILQWNLFDATILARRDAAKARAEVARADLDYARMNVGLLTERAYLDLDAALKTLPGLQASVDAAKANQAQAEARFKAGLGTVVELADAEALLTNAQLELAVGQFAVARARAVLGRVMGQSLLRASR
jgi:outer membrane protein TolC